MRTILALVALAAACAQAAEPKVLRYAFEVAETSFDPHRILTDMWYPWVIGFRRPSMLGNHFWKYVDIDVAKVPVK